MQKKSKYTIKEDSGNLVEYVYEFLKADLTNNKIKAGDFISANSIAKKLNVSRTPVREALRILANDDIIEIIDGIGVQVKTMSSKEIRDIFEVRKALEKIAARTAIYNISMDEMIALEEQIKKLAKGLDESTPIDAFHAKHNRVHGFMVERCNNSYVKKIMESIGFKISMCKYLSVQTEEKVRESSAQHLRILEYMKTKDMENLERAIDEHVQWTLEILLDL